MGHGHAHSSKTPADRNSSRLAIVFGLTLFYLAVEVVAGLMTDSLALLADAGHMLTDVAGVGMALLAIWFARRPASPEKTYGYHRVEILAAAVNAVVLLGVSAGVLYEAYRRFLDPPEVQSGWMLGVAVVGLVVNGAGILLLQSGSGESLNLKGAYYEVLSDTLTSVGVILAAGIMMATGWYVVDPLISAGIGLFILPRTWSLLSEAVGILLEGTPKDVDLEAIRSEIERLDGVEGVHDLHAWSLTSGVNALSAHVVMDERRSLREVLTVVRDCVTGRFPIHHVTVQVEPPGWEQHDTHP